LRFALLSDSLVEESDDAIASVVLLYVITLITCRYEYKLCHEAAELPRT